MNRPLVAVVVPGSPARVRPRHVSSCLCTLRKLTVGSRHLPCCKRAAPECQAGVGCRQDPPTKASRAGGALGIELLLAQNSER